MLKKYGSGQIGLKAEDLERYREMVTSLGMKVPDGMVVLTEVFFQTMKVLGLTEKSSLKKLLEAMCPEHLAVINREILGEMKTGVPYAIRSSALSERGGTGIYHTSFFIPTGKQDSDLEKLWEKEKEVYASEFTADARAWRKKNNVQIGMAILIQEVKGYRFENYFLP
jgi:phosphoenolpyruvate synthase/pyruvate phosphate dikinase